MSKEALLAQITADPRLPTPPTVALQIVEKANRPNCTILEIAQLLSQDPALCGRILKMVNSSLFALPRAVSSIERAMNLLGLKRVRSLVLSLSLTSMQGRNQATTRMRDYWKSSVATAIVARELAARRSGGDPDSDMVAGLLCDLGVLILQEVFCEQYAKILTMPQEALVLNQCDVEENLFGVHHAEVSAYLLKRWRLPEEMTQAIAWHHHPAKAPAAHQERAHLLYFASRVAQLQLTVGESTLLAEVLALARDRYKMNDQALREFLEPVTRGIEECAALLQVDIGACHEYSTLIASATENLTRLAVETSLDNVRVEEEKNRAESDLKKTAEALHHAEAKLRQALKMEAIGRLAGGVAHDFNNLLTIINGYSELVLTLLPGDHSCRGFLEEIQKAGQRAADLTRQLLAFSRKQILVPEVLSLNDVLVSLEKMLRRLIREDIELVLTLAPDLHAVKVDPSQIDQVIMNLAVNARDAMPQGGRLVLETANLELDAVYTAPYEDLKPGPYVLLAISDSGVGMSEEVKARIFEPFFTTKDGKGTGLGLATVHGIIKQSGGHIAVYSEVNHGTTFKIYLPALTEIVAARKSETPSEEMPRGEETILLTEDEESVRRMARHTLERQGYKVLEARNGWEALKMSQDFQAPIHLLITDTIMPHMGGCELAERLTHARPTCKVLYTSGYTDDAIIRNGVLDSNMPFLQKPFTPRALACKIREVLQTEKPRQTNPNHTC